jgi:hypothetical protein
MTSNLTFGGPGWCPNLMRMRLLQKEKEEEAKI